jgi:uncharacterized protein
MQKYVAIMNRLTVSCSTEKIRYLYHQVDWNQRLIGIVGARGSGKTTLMLQFIKLNYPDLENVLYLSIDRVFPPDFNIYQLAERFYMQGGRHLLLDEVHKYPGWAVELKNIYDDFPALKLIFTGSSALLLHRAEADLSRRASMYHLRNLSFREFILFKTDLRFEPVGLEEVLETHLKLTADINQNIRPVQLFHEFTKFGAYPYYFENPMLYHDRVMATVKTIIETDFPAIASFSYSSVVAVQKLLSFIADSVPFKPNIAELSRKTGISRDVLLRMIDLLVRADLLLILRQQSAPTGYFTKPDKIYLHNSSLAWALSQSTEPDAGNIRETFFINQLEGLHQLSLPDSGDFLIDNKYLIKIGGPNKTRKQLQHAANAYVLRDQIETGHKNIIPLWLFGFLY